jgi:Fe-S cluster assembly iron-binding protein IscA
LPNKRGDHTAFHVFNVTGFLPVFDVTDDQVIEHEGAAVLLVGREVAEKVEGTTIDHEEGDPGPGLVIKKD